MTSVTPKIHFATTNNICAKMRENLEMSVKHAYMIRTTYYHEYFPFKKTKIMLYMISGNFNAKDDTFYRKIKV